MFDYEFILNTWAKIIKIAIDQNNRRYLIRTKYKVPYVMDELFLWVMAKHSDHTRKQLKMLGNRIRQIRKARGFSNYEQFAYKYDFNRSSYSRFESGEDIRFSSLLKILEAFEMSLAEFFSEGFEGGNPDEEGPD